MLCRWVYQAYKDELIPFLLKLFQKKLKRKVYFPTHSVRPVLPWDQNKTKTPQKGKKEKENYKPVSLMIIKAKILNKILAKRIQQYIKMIIHHDQVGFIPGVLGCTISHKSIYKNHDYLNACILKSLQLCLTLCNPMDCSLPGSPIQGIFLARILE